MFECSFGYSLVTLQLLDGPFPFGGEKPFDWQWFLILQLEAWRCKQTLDIGCQLLAFLIRVLQPSVCVLKTNSPPPCFWSNHSDVLVVVSGLMLTVGRFSMLKHPEKLIPLALSG